MNATALPAPIHDERNARDTRADRGFRWLVTGAGLFVLVALGAAAFSMLWGGRAAFQEFGLSFLWSDVWDPVGQ